MRQIEITTRVIEPKQAVFAKLEALGFIKIRSYTIDDSYQCSDLVGLHQDNIAEFLKQCVLIRSVDTGSTVFKKLVYKNKTFKDGITLGEEKIEVQIDDVAKARALLGALNFAELVRVKYECAVYAKDGMELALQDVDNLGLLIEYEHNDDFTSQDESIILQTKQTMLQAVKDLGIATSDEFDVKKAYELVMKKI